MLDALDDSLLLVTYIILDILESLLEDSQLYYKNYSNKWDQLHL